MLNYIRNLYRVGEGSGLYIKMYEMGVNVKKLFFLVLMLWIVYVSSFNF